MSATETKAKITAAQLYIGQKVTIRHTGKEVTGQVLELAGDRFCFISDKTGAFWAPISVIEKLG